MKIRFVFAFALMLLSSGCSLSGQRTSDEYRKAALSVRLGDSKAEVLRVLEPTQRRFRKTGRPQSEMFIRNGRRVDILYFRSGTRGEITPYMFRSDRLVAVGWTGLHAAVSGGRVKPRLRMHGRTIIPPF